MNIILRSLVLAIIPILMMSYAYTVPAQEIPANDLCINAIPLFCGNVVVGSTENATNDSNLAYTCGGNEVFEDSRGVWYKFTGTGDRITLSTCNNQSFDTSISVYTGSCTTGLVCVAGNDDGYGCPSFTSKLPFNSVAGYDYLILVDGYQDSDGEFEFSITCDPLTDVDIPQNDVCSTAQTLQVYPMGISEPTAGTTAFANPFNGVVECFGFENVVDVWYLFNSGVTRQLKLRVTKNIIRRFGLVVYENSCTGPVVACAYGFFNEIEEVLTVKPNTNYFAMVHSPETPITFDILVEEYNEPAEIEDIDPISVSRYLEAGDVVAELKWLDEMDDDQVFSIIAGNDAGILAIDNYGVISVASASALQAVASGYETTLTVQAHDQGPGNPTSTVEVELTMLDNHRPVMAEQNISIAYGNIPIGGHLANLVASDEDNDRVYFESQALEGDPHSYFAVNNINGHLSATPLYISLLGSGNRSVPLQHRLRIGFRDEHDSFNSGIVNLDFSENNRPTITGHSYNIARNATQGTFVGEIEFGDANLDLLRFGQTHTLEIVGSGEEGSFSINNEGRLIVNDAAALSAGPDNYSLEIKVTDNGQPPLSHSARYDIQVVNAHAPVITKTSFLVNENVRTVGTLLATDEDGDQVSFRVVGSDLFTVVDQNRLRANQLFDFEKKSSHLVELEAIDNSAHQLRSRALVTISVNNVDEPAVGQYQFLRISASTQNGAAIGNLGAVDPEGDLITYVIQSGNDEGIFAIDDNGNIVVADATKLDAIAKPTHRLTVVVFSSIFWIANFVDIGVFLNADNPVLTSTDFYISENVGNPDDGSYYLGRLTGSDSHGIFRYELMEDRSDVYVDNDTGELRIDGVPFDHEKTQQIQFEARLLDYGPGHLAGVGTVTIHIVDVNEFDPVFGAQLLNPLHENAAVGTSVATLPASDDDVTQTLHYSIISGNAGGAFQIGNDGVIKVANSSVLDFETTSTFSLTIEVRDDVEPIRTAQQQVAINLININEAPVLASIDNKSIEEDLQLSFKAIATDVDKDVVSYTLDASAVAKGMTIDPATGTFTWTPDNNQVGSHEVTVTASDGKLIDSKTLIVTVSPVNDAPTLVVNTGLSLTQGALVKITDTQLQATDVDNTPSELTFTIATAPTNGELKKGVTKVAIGEVFTQADINAGLMGYDHNGFNGAVDKFTFTVSDGRGGVAPPADFLLSIDIVTAIEKDPGSGGITVSPNPAKDVLMITIVDDFRGQVELGLLDVSGRDLETKSVSKTGQTLNESLGLSPYPSGVLILQVRTKESVRSYRVMRNP